ncbi:MAG: hypothetical protein KIS96_10940 [Bauldia sp.]|nr:hypothetical protein [Bauldia sp.]
MTSLGRGLMALVALVAMAGGAQAREERYLCYGTHTTAREHGPAEGVEREPGRPAEIETEGGSIIVVQWSAAFQFYTISDADGVGPYAKCGFTEETIFCGEGPDLRFLMDTVNLVFTQLDARALVGLRGPDGADESVALKVQTGECRIAPAGEEPL